MGRTRNPITGNGPRAALARQLRLLQDTSGLNTRALSEKSCYSIGTLSEAMAGKKVPTWEVTRAIVEACGGDAADWHERWAMAQQQDIVVRRPRLDPRFSAREILHVVAGPPPVPDDRVTTVEEFIETLHRVRTWAGRPTYREIAYRGLLSPSTVCDLLKNKTGRLPSLFPVLEFLKGCGVSDPEVFAEWTFHWRRLEGQQLRVLNPYRPRLVSVASPGPAQAR